VNIKIQGERLRKLGGKQKTSSTGFVGSVFYIDIIVLLIK